MELKITPLSREIVTNPQRPHSTKIPLILAIAGLLILIFFSVSPVLAVSGSCVTVSQARAQAAAGKLRPEYARMTDEQLYALGFCADLPGTTSAPATGCSPGYTRYTTSAGHCCQTGYPFYRDGACHKCQEGYYVFGTSEGHCCREGYPYYYDGACYKCQEGYYVFGTSEGQCCREGYPYYYDGVCNSVAQDTEGGGDGGTGDDGDLFAVLFFFMTGFILIAGIAAVLSGRKPGPPKAGQLAPPQEPEMTPRMMHGLMQYGGDAPGRVITKGAGPAPRNFHGPGSSHPSYTAGVPAGGEESQAGIPPSWPSADGGHRVEGPGVIPSAPVHPPVSGLQVSRAGDTVHLEWRAPEYDPSREQLVGYEVFRQEPVSTGTALQRVSLGTVDPGVLGYDVRFMEGARFYNVRPIYRTVEGIMYGPGSDDLRAGR